MLLRCCFLETAMTDRYLLNRLPLRYAHVDPAKVRSRRPWLNLGDRFGSLYFAPRGCSSMRSVAAVVALVVCVHAVLWTLLQRQQTVANIDAPLASVSYSPYTRSQHPDYGDRPTPSKFAPT